MVEYTYQKDQGWVMIIVKCAGCEKPAAYTCQYSPPTCVKCKSFCCAPIKDNQ